MKYFREYNPWTPEEILFFLIEEGRNTKRKQMFTLNRDIRELSETIADLETRLEGKDFVMLHGDRYDDTSVRHLRRDLAAYLILRERIS